MLVTVVTLIGAAYVAVLGLLAARRSLAPSALTLGSDGLGGRWATIGTALAVTWLNPARLRRHRVDTGRRSKQSWAAGEVEVRGRCRPGEHRVVRGAAVKLAPMFARPRAWRILDAVVAVIMLAIGAGLIVSAW